LFGYRDGERFIIDTLPEIINYSDIELLKLANIEKKLKNALHENTVSQSSDNGIDEHEA
jgi:hypothetical protein